MARCTDCIHYEACLRFADLRVILCGDEADTKCIMFKPTADVAPRAEVAREIFEEIEKTVNDCVVDESLFKPAYFEFRKFNVHIAELKKKYTQPEPPKTD